MTIVTIVFASFTDAEKNYNNAKESWKKQIAAVLKRTMATPSLGVDGAVLSTEDAALLKRIIYMS